MARGGTNSTGNCSDSSTRRVSTRRSGGSKRHRRSASQRGGGSVRRPSGSGSTTGRTEDGAQRFYQTIHETVTVHEIIATVVSALTDEIIRIVSSTSRKGAAADALDALAVGGVRIAGGGPAFVDFETAVITDIVDRLGVGAGSPLERHIRVKFAREFAPFRVGTIVRLLAAWKRRSLGVYLAYAEGDAAVGSALGNDCVARMRRTAEALDATVERLLKFLTNIPPSTDSVDFYWEVLDLFIRWSEALVNDELAMSRQIRFEIPHDIRFDAALQPRNAVRYTIGVVVDAWLDTFVTRYVAFYEAYADHLQRWASEKAPATSSAGVDNELSAIFTFAQFTIRLDEAVKQRLNAAVNEANMQFRRAARLSRDRARHLSVSMKRAGAKDRLKALFGVGLLRVHAAFSEQSFEDYVGRDDVSVRREDKRVGSRIERIQTRLDTIQADVVERLAAGMDGQQRDFLEYLAERITEIIREFVRLSASPDFDLRNPDSQIIDCYDIGDIEN